MKRIIKIGNVYGVEDKYVLIDEYDGFGIYQEKTPNGYSVHQSWLISNNNNVELVVTSFNNLCKEELLDMIDNYNQTGKFGIRAVVYHGVLHMHNCGKLI